MKTKMNTLYLKHPRGGRQKKMSHPAGARDGGEAKEPVGPVDEYEWDPNYFPTFDEALTRLSEKHGEVKQVWKQMSYTVVFFANKALNLFTRFIGGKKRVWRITGDTAEYPISLPTDYELITLRPGDTMYRMRNDNEGPKIGDHRFYAERSTFKFRGTASTGYEHGGLYKYVVLEPITIVNFNKRWRSRIWGGDEDNDVAGYHSYETILQQVCEEVGAQGWRAGVWGDQRPAVQAKKFLEADPEFEIALFSSELVKSLGKIKTVDAAWNWHDVELRF